MEAIAIPEQEAQTVADAILKEVFCKLGIPRQLHSDQGRNFESKLFQEMCSKLGIDKTRTSPLRPQSDGMVERFNRTLEAMLSMFVADHQRDWDEHLPIVMMAYRATKHESTGCSPNKMMLGREVEIPVDLLYRVPSDTEDEVPEGLVYVAQLQETMEEVHAFASQQLQKSSERQKRNYDHQTVQKRFKPGDLVWLYSPKRTKGRCPKLQSVWQGPCRVLIRFSDVLYKIQLKRRTKTMVVHCDRLRKYQGQEQLGSETEVSASRVGRGNHEREPVSDESSVEETVGVGLGKSDDPGSPREPDHLPAADDLNDHGLGPENTTGDKSHRAGGSDVEKTSAPHADRRRSERQRRSPRRYSPS